MFILNPHSSVPIYQQLVEQVRRMVAGGQLAPGTELPSVREMAQEHTVHPMTISKAYSLLEAEGVLERHRGKPMRVAAQRRDQLNLAARLKQIDPQLDALALSARQLELSPEEVIAQLKKKLGDKS
ncbi:MAG TPA: GntR family transcriptional regulator [Steroidobacteraceae bacterium]|nr:GntR family transcriptional regulator [Steroidobacteraceae bacterium]